MAEIARIPCRLCSAPAAPIAGGFCVDCVEDGHAVWVDNVGWRATPAATRRAHRGLWRVLLVELAMMLPRMVRDDWREHRGMVAARRAREQALAGEGGVMDGLFSAGCGAGVCAWGVGVGPGGRRRGSTIRSGSSDPEINQRPGLRIPGALRSAI